MLLLVLKTENYQHQGALRGTPESAWSQPEPNATELPSCASISASRELRKDSGAGGGGGGVAGRARTTRALEGKVLLCHILRHVLRRVLHVLVIYVSPKGKRGGRHACVGRGFCRCEMTRAMMSTFIF